MKDNILEIRNLKKIYHDKNGETLALNKINLDLKDGEFISLVGPSGCGKSTILSILANLIDKSDGKITFKNDATIGYMLQKDSLLNWQTVLDNCLLGLKLTKQLNNDSRNRVLELIKKYGLNDFKDKYPSSLSGGMRQRTALIRTLAINPQILLLDEPFSALDYQTRLALSDDLYYIIKQEKKAVIMVTHDIAEAISMSDRVIVLSKRPAEIKNIYVIDFKEKNIPTENRKNKKFINYYETIWKDLDVHV